MPEIDFIFSSRVVRTARTRRPLTLNRHETRCEPVPPNVTPRHPEPLHLIGGDRVLKLSTFLIAVVVGWIASRLGRRAAPRHRPARVAPSPPAEPARTRHPAPAPPPPTRRRGLTPPELQRACFAEMMRHVSLDRGGRGIVPSGYQLHLHPDDVAIVEENRGWFLDGLKKALRDAAADRGWSLDKSVSIEVLADASRRPGVPRVAGSPPTPTPRRRRSGPVG